MSDSPSATPQPEPGRIVRRQTSGQRGWTRWLPGLQTLRSYEASWLRHDIVAGLVLTTMLVPVGIAYAVASGLPGIYGLYATIVPLLAYALFGPSRIMVLGPDSSLAPLILAVVLPLAAGDAGRAVAVAGMLAVVSGLLCILAAVVGATLAVAALDLSARAGVAVLGQLPQGLPAFAIPWPAFDDIVPVLTGGFAIALVSFADTSVLSRTYAARTGRPVDP